MRIISQLLSLLWPLFSAAAVIVLTPSALVAIFHGDLAAAGVCALILVPAFYILLSVYFEHLLERRFALSTEEKERIGEDLPIWSDVLFQYGLSRRRMLRAALNTPGALLRGSPSAYRKLIVLHQVLGWAFVVECVLFVVVLAAERLQS